MAKPRKKKRTQPAPGSQATSNGSQSKPGTRMPKSMVIRTNASETGPSITQLVQDVRTMLQPDTAVRLKERRNNKLRDFTTMAGPLGVTHLIMFSRSKSGNVNCRVAVTPRGPTMTFRVEGYSLAKDIMKSQRRPKGGEKELYLAAPLLVMNNFVSTEEEQEGKSADGKTGDGKKKVPKHLETLATTVFQSLFPPINPTAKPLKNIKRVLLMDRVQPSNDEPSFALNLRHYSITTRTPKSVPKPLRRLDASQHVSHAGQKRKRDGLPNLGRLDDVSDFLLDPHAAEGFASGSESEPETDAEVEVLAPSAQRVSSRHSKARNKDSEDQPSRPKTNREEGENVEKKAIKLQELGPRLQLRLTKVEEGLCGGKVMWHEYIHKSAQEVKAMDKVHEQRRQERERRKAEQKANVERKKKERQANGEEAVEDEEMEEGMDEWDDYESDLDEGGVDVGAEDEEEGEEDEDMDDE